MADPRDFVILEYGEAEYVGHGQQSCNDSECRTLEEAYTSDRGKSSFRKPSKK